MNRVEAAENRVPIRTILASCYDKSGLTDFLARVISAAPVARVIASGGTYREIERHLGDTLKDRLTRLSDFTGQPEMQGGLVKSLDFHIYAALLAEPGNKEHQGDLERLGTPYLDMVVTNLYPFAEVTAAPSNDLEDARGNIDIGGPAMLRAAAKNFLRVAPVCDVADYDRVAAELEEQDGSLLLATRAWLAQKVFRATADYDRAITEYLAGSQDQVERLYL